MSKITGMVSMQELLLKDRLNKHLRVVIIIAACESTKKCLKL